MAGIMRVTGGLLFAFAGLYGMVLCFGLVADVFGNAVAFISLIFFPVLLGIAPWYALLANGDFVPLLVTYGGGIPAFVLWGLAEKFDKR
tara:strand:- start:27 stop:293 length:267 start_codon:yes stop_codon:yes gene_type:complete